MHDALKELNEALIDLGDYVLTLKVDDTLLSEKYGISAPGLLPEDLSDYPIYISSKIMDYDLNDITEDEENEIKSLTYKIKRTKDITTPHLFTGNSALASSAYISTLSYATVFLDSLYTFKNLTDSNLVPRNMTRRIKSFDARLNEISPNIENLENKIQVILDAHTAAENIPIDLEELRAYNIEASELRDKILKTQFSLESQEQIAIDVLKSLIDKDAQAQEYLDMCEKAIRASTSKGLAGAFEIKANKLNWSIRLWVGGLASALATGGWVGYERLKSLSEILNKPDPSAVVIITQVLLSVFSIGAPLWFAWLSTRQINQRFKLAEDYAYKSSVAKAYEGYRNEASKTSDGEFQKRLFDSALSRLEEPPLRFMQEHDHSTPWAELLNSKAFQQFLDASVENLNFVKKIVNKNIPIPLVASNSDSSSAEKKAE